MKVFNEANKKIGPMDDICVSFLKKYAKSRGYLIIIRTLDLKLNKKENYIIFEQLNESPGVMYNTDRYTFADSSCERIEMTDIYNNLLSTYFK